MNKKNIDWENWEKEGEKERAETNLKKSKSGSIAYIEEKNELNRWDIYHTHWENWLSSSDYWKNWQEKINNFQTKREVDFYTSRLSAFIEFVQEHTRKDIRYVEDAKPWTQVTTPQLIKQELKRLENISEEEFRKTDKWRNSTEWREMTIKEISDMLDYSPNEKVDKKLNKALINSSSQSDKKGDNFFLLLAVGATLAVAITGWIMYSNKKRD